MALSMSAKILRHRVEFWGGASWFHYRYANFDNEGEPRKKALEKEKAFVEKYGFERYKQEIIVPMIVNYVKENGV